MKKQKILKIKVRAAAYAIKTATITHKSAKDYKRVSSRELMKQI